MQRVAIARALVNDPDILLADEPTGALDTETSVSVMDLLREVAKDKLVIMVTHNPELAEEYSSRIIRLLDGRVVGDTNPYTAPESAPAAESAEKPRRTRRRSRSMSFLTALSLSLNNLMTKKGRTFLTSFAGSIGIIGIALILSLSNGINAYILRVQEETLTSYPISIYREETDLSALISSFMGASESSAEHAVEDKVYSSAVFYSLVNAILNPEMNTNNLRPFKAYLESGVLDHLDVTLQYGYDISLPIWSQSVDGSGNTVFTKSDIGALLASISGTGMGGSVSDSESSTMSSSFSGFSVWQEVLAGKDGAYVSELVKEQYELLDGDWPSSMTDVILVVDENNEVNDITLYSLGLKSEDEMLELLMAALSGGGINVEEEVKSWEYSEICGRTFKFLLPADTYDYDKFSEVWVDLSSDDQYAERLKMALITKGLDLRISCIVRAKPDAMVSTSSGTLLYTSALTSYMLRETLTSDAVLAQLADPKTDIFTGKPFEIDPETLPKDDAERALAFAEHVAALDDAAKTDLLYAMLTTPSDEEIAASIEKIIDSFDTVDDVIASMQTMYKEAYGASDEVSEMMAEHLRQIAHEDEKALYALFAGMLDTPLRSEYKKAGEAKFEAIKSTPSDAELDAVAGLILLNIPSSGYRDFVISTLSAATSMSEDALGAWYDALDTAGREAALTSAARSLARERYPLYAAELSTDPFYAAQFSTDRKCAAALDEMLADMTEAALADAYLRFVDDGSSPSSYSENLTRLGVADPESPDSISIYVGTFADKDAVRAIIEEYNASVENEDDRIEYTDLVAMLMSSVTIILDAITYVLVAFVSISLVVSSIMIGIITYISVLERTKEIGILRAVGASKRDVSRVFNAETLLVGFAAGMIGITVTLLICIPINLILRALTGISTIGAVLPLGAAALLVAISMTLTLIAGLLPSRVASRKDPVVALRTE
ncbi:MAG: FtsX-like permease family protein [Clostridia bacterium]|nr:FtsX-like permease family protein [Clostridia bacterium]